MRCPVCKSGFLNADALDENLVTASCLHCGGHWVKAYQYWQWRNAQPAPSEDFDTSDAPHPEIKDSRPGKRCPECSRFLARRRVGKGLTFHLDRCDNCGGVWFDHHEWEALRARNLHRDAHFIFTAAYQAAVKRDQQDAAERKRHVEHFGEKDLTEIDRIREWITTHPRACEIRALLLEDAAQHT